MKIVRALSKTVAILAFAACATSPTGRSQVMIFPEDQMDAMGAQAFTQLKTQEPLERDQSTNAYVKCIATAITNAMDQQQNWEVAVFKSDQVNAFALPGGRIGVYAGMLKVAQTPSQLAAVMGHEVAHVIAQHGRERASRTLLTQGGLAALTGIMAERGPRYQLLMGAIGLGTQFGVTLPHGRAQETESDIMGLELMAKAGFDPQEAVQLWRNMAASGGGSPPEFMSTHPSNETRIENLQSRMPAALAIYQQNRNRPNCRR